MVKLNKVLIDIFCRAPFNVRETHSRRQLLVSSIIECVNFGRFRPIVGWVGRHIKPKFGRTADLVPSLVACLKTLKNPHLQSSAGSHYISLVFNSLDYVAGAGQEGPRVADAIRAVFLGGGAVMRRPFRTYRCRQLRVMIDVMINVRPAPSGQVARLLALGELHGLFHGLVKIILGERLADPPSHEISPQELAERRGVLGETANATQFAGDAAERVVLEPRDLLGN